jgi:hypothetical protein
LQECKIGFQETLFHHFITTLVAIYFSVYFEVLYCGSLSKQYIDLFLFCLPNVAYTTMYHKKSPPKKQNEKYIATRVVIK